MDRETNERSLIIYFSHTGENWINGEIKVINKGNTEIVAEELANITQSEKFKVEEIIPYPINYNECCDIAKIELNENKHPELVKYLNNIEEYKTIYIGGPVWWGHLPMPLQTQLEKLDFSGKIVKLFTTHEGSGLGNCEDDIKKLCKNANIGKSIAICGSKAKESKSRLEEWVKE